jgi:predicted glutamine amidotransferase
VCRLFALSGGPRRVHATFWLLDAPDSLAAQSHANPDGTGIGTFDEDGRPVLDKQPIAAFADEAYARAARTACSRTFVAHVRHASTGAPTRENTHPFEADGRLFAHNGVVEGLPEIEDRLGREGMARVAGDTDSERVFALITREVASHGGDVAAGVEAAVGWLAATVPLFSVNLVLTTATEIWALRYPEPNELWVLERERGGHHGHRQLDAAGAPGTVRVRSTEMRGCPSVVLASEPMDEHPGWRLLEPGELVHVARDLAVRRRMILPDPPAHGLSLAALGAEAAASQTAAP